MPEQTKYVNFYPGFKPRKTNWQDMQDARLQAENSKWNQTKQYGLVTGGAINPNVAAGTFSVAALVAFDRTGDRIEIPSGAEGDGKQYNAADPVLVDNQNPPASIAKSSGSKNVPLLKNTANVPVDTYVFVESIQTIDQAAVNKHLPNRHFEYPKVDLGFNIITLNQANAISEILGSDTKVFLGVIRVNGSFAAVLKEFAINKPAQVGFQSFQVPYLLGSDLRDTKGGVRHDHEGPFLRGRLLIETANTVVRIRVQDNNNLSDYQDFFLADGTSQGAVAANHLYTTGLPTFVGAPNEFSIPLSHFAGKSVRVFLSNTGYFLMPAPSGGFPGTPDSRAGLTPTQQTELHRVYWDGLRIEVTHNDSLFEETVYLPNHSFDFQDATPGALGVEGTGPIASAGAQDCQIPGWTNAAGTNVPNRMIVVPSSTVPAFTNAGLFLLETYSTAAGDQTFAPSVLDGRFAGAVPTNRFCVGGNLSQYTLVTVPYEGDPDVGNDLIDAMTDYDNRNPVPSQPQLASVTPQNAVPAVVPMPVAPLNTRGAGAVTVSTRNKWFSVGQAIQRLWTRFLEHRHDSVSGCQQVVTDGLADGSVTQIKLDSTTLVTGTGPSLFPNPLCAISLTGTCPAGWAPVGTPGSFLLLAAGPSAVNGVARAAGLAQTDLVKSTAVAVGNHSHNINNDPVQVKGGSGGDPYAQNGVNDFSTDGAGAFSTAHSHDVPVMTVTLCQKL